MHPHHVPPWQIRRNRAMRVAKIAILTSWLMLMAAIVLAPHVHAAERGMASWYKPTGHRTASGEKFNPSMLTCAHRTLPFGVRLRVTRPSLHLQTICRVNDRGPFRRGRIVDLTRRGAQELRMIGDGVAHVIIEVLP